jgi:hypothetical protein
MQIRDRKDFVGGLMLVGFGAGALIIARNYRIGTAFRMGPGYLPVVLASVLVAIGLIVAIKALRSGDVKLPQVAWRPLIIVSLAIALFGLLINGAGLLISTFVMLVVSRVARSGYPWLETIILSLSLTVLFVGIFYYGLKIQMPLLPTWWG